VSVRVPTSMHETAQHASRAQAEAENENENDSRGGRRTRRVCRDGTNMCVRVWISVLTEM